MVTLQLIISKQLPSHKRETINLLKCTSLVVYMLVHNDADNDDASLRTAVVSTVSVAVKFKWCAHIRKVRAITVTHCVPFVKHIFTPKWLNDWLSVSPAYTAYCTSQFPKQDGRMYSNSDTYQTVFENYLVRFGKTLGFGLKPPRYYCNFSYKHTYVNKVPALLDYVSKFKELTNDFWFHTGHQQRPREWKSSVCLTDHPSPASAPHGVLALLLTSSLQLLLLTTATRGCRVSTNIIWVMISWLHLRPIWSFFRWGQAAGCTPTCCVTRQLVQKVEQPKQSSLNR